MITQREIALIFLSNSLNLFLKKTGMKKDSESKKLAGLLAWPGSTIE